VEWKRDLKIHILYILAQKYIGTVCLIGISTLPTTHDISRYKNLSF